MVDDVTLKKCQEIQLGLLKDFDRVCRERNWTYWLDGGTLLGAIRHKGFIPWDDDIDVAMPRSDFEAFARNGQKYIDSNIFLQTMETDCFPESFCIKLRDRKSALIEKGEENRYIPYHQGIFIDIFPIDVIKRESVKKALCLFKFFDKISWIRRLVYIQRKSIKRRKTLSKIAIALFFPVACIIRIFLRNEYVYSKTLYRKQFSLYKTFWSSTDDGVYFLPFRCADFPNKLFNKNDIFPLAKILFENECFPAPFNPDIYLQRQYGDYMKAPPPEKRESHSHDILPDTPCNHPESFKS
ncbi:MAG: LicD family protein [Treponema sp.]|jgi:lipopolysaccharide cholinephosphotransferase|nr:LicD family protein [Treponema sp.]